MIATLTEPPATFPSGYAPIAHQILDRTELGTLPKPAPLIENTLDLGTVSVLAGYWGTLKSFIALDWASSVVTGRPWLGRPVTEEGIDVLYVAAEGAYGLDDRLTAWERAWGRTIPEETFKVLPRPVHLGNPNDVLELAGFIEKERYRFVIIDTLAKCITGMDENSAKDMGTAVGSLYDLQRATQGGTILAVHHTGKDKSTIRGSSALESGVDTVHVTEGDPSNLTLTRTKRKNGPTPDTLRLKFAQVSTTESGVIEVQNGVGISQAARDLHSHFHSHHSEIGASRSELAKSSGMPTSTFYRAVNALVSEGTLINQGTDSRPYYHLAHK